VARCAGRALRAPKAADAPGSRTATLPPRTAGRPTSLLSTRAWIRKRWPGSRWCRSWKPE